MEGLEEAAEAAVPVATSRVTAGAAVARTAGTALSILGVLLVLFAAYLFGYTNLQAVRSQRRLLSIYTVTGEKPAFAGRTPSDGAPVGILTIPALGIDEVVVQGTSSTDLQNGPGLMPKGAVPGSRGDAVVAGRRSTFGAPFKAISSLRSGDEVRIVDYLGRFTYRVSDVRVLASRTPVVVRPTIKPLLTLLTSAESAPPSGLVEVTAVLAGKPLPTAVASPPAAASELHLNGSASWQLPVWGALLIACLTATVLAYRRVRRPLLVYLLSMPVLLPVTLFVFENAARLLPATM